MNLLRKYVRLIVREAADNGKTNKEKRDEDLLLEPDEINDPDDKSELNTVANIAGVSTPLGTGPTYPLKSKKKRKNPAEIVGGDYRDYSIPKRKKMNVERGN